MKLELFPCSGGMAEGFRRAGITFDMAIDKDKDACDSYEKNLGHRPIQMDAGNLLRMVAGGWRMPVELLVADPPCTPWSRAGTRKGIADERDCLVVTTELIALLRPTCFMIANVPGLDDGPNWGVVQRHIGGLSKHGYCVADFTNLNAADYGVPQIRIRPFWFGHPQGTPCLRWPAPSHGEIDPRQLAIAGTALRPWVTCKAALSHLPPAELGRPIRLRKRACRASVHGSVGARPARTVGTSNLSDGNVLVPGAEGAPPRAFHNPPPPAELVMRERTDGTVREHAPSRPARTLRASRSNSERLLIEPLAELTEHRRHPVSEAASPARTITASDGAGAKGGRVLRTNDRHPINTPGAPAVGPRPPSASKTVTTHGDSMAGGQGAAVLALDLDWPWDRPATTIAADERLQPPGHHDEDWAARSLPNAVVISEKAAAILQGFPPHWVFAGKTKRSRWSQIGQAMPPGLSAAVAHEVAAWMAAHITKEQA